MWPAGGGGFSRQSVSSGASEAPESGRAVAVETEEQYQARLRAWQAKAASGDPFPGPVPRRGDREPIGQGVQIPMLTPESPGASLNTAQADSERQRLGSLLEQLQGQASTGAGAWEQALRQNTASTQASAMALGQSQNLDPMTAARNIGNAQAGAAQRAVGQGNLLRAQSQQAATGQISDILSGQGALDAQQANSSYMVDQGRRQANNQIRAQAQKADRDLFGAAGQAVTSAAFSEGGSVPGEPKVFGDSSVNDTVPAKLTPLEIVLPLSVTMRPDAPEAAAAFVAAVKARKPEAYAGGEMGFDDGGEVPLFAHSEIDSPSTSLYAPSPSAPLDARPYDASREGGLRNAGRFEDMLAGRGPSVAPQAMQNATDTTLADAVRAGASSRGMGRAAGAGNVLLDSSAQQQAAAGNAAGLVAGESQRAAGSLAEALQRQRAQDLSFALAQQQAAYRDELMSRGVALEQQQQLKNLYGAAGQGVTSLTSMLPNMFDMGDSPSHSGFSSDRSALETGKDRSDSSLGYDYDSADHYAEGGIVGHLARKTDPRRKRTYSEAGARKPEQGTPEEWAEFPQKRALGTQWEMSGPEQHFAGGGPVFYGVESSAPQPGPFAQQPPSDIPSALRALRSILTPPAFMLPPGGPRGEDIPLSPEVQAQRLATSPGPKPKPPPAEPALPHSPNMTQRPFATPASRAPMPATEAAKPIAKPGTPAAPKADPYADQQKALAMKADAEGALATEQAGILGGLQRELQQSAIEQKEIRARAQESAEQQLGALQQAREELKAVDTTVDPDRYMARKGWGGKVAAVIGLALGAIGNDNGTNRAAQLLNQQIDRDLDAQKAEHELTLRKGQSAVDSAQTIYALSRQMTQDDIAANLAARGTMLDLAKNQVDIAAAKAGAPLAKSNLANLSAQLGVEKQKADDAARARLQDMGLKWYAAKTDRMQTEAQAAASGAKAAAGDKTQAALIANVEQENKTIQDQGQQLKALIKKHGTSGGLTGPGKAEMQQTLTNMATAAAKLRDPNSVARSSEVDAELKNLFQPGFLQKEETAIAAIDSYLKNAEQRRNDAYSVRGLAAPGAAVESTPMPTATGKDGKKVKWNGSAWVPM